jgi:putative transposase
VIVWIAPLVFWTVARKAGRDDGLASTAPLLRLVPDWEGFLGIGLAKAEHETIRAAERMGRPLGAAEFVADLERRAGRALAPRKPGPKPKAPPAD